MRAKCVDTSISLLYADSEDVSEPKRATQMSGVCIGADIYLDVYWNDFMYTRIVEVT